MVLNSLVKSKIAGQGKFQDAIDILMQPKSEEREDVSEVIGRSDSSTGKTRRMLQDILALDNWWLTVQSHNIGNIVYFNYYANCYVLKERKVK